MFRGVEICCDRSKTINPQHNVGSGLATVGRHVNCVVRVVRVVRVVSVVRVVCSLTESDLVARVPRPTKRVWLRETRWCG